MSEIFRICIRIIHCWPLFRSFVHHVQQLQLQDFSAHSLSQCVAVPVFVCITAHDHFLFEAFDRKWIFRLIILIVSVQNAEYKWVKKYYTRPFRFAVTSVRHGWRTMVASCADADGMRWMIKSTPTYFNRHRVVLVFLAVKKHTDLFLTSRRGHNVKKRRKSG